MDLATVKRNMKNGLYVPKMILQKDKSTHKSKTWDFFYLIYDDAQNVVPHWYWCPDCFDLFNIVLSKDGNWKLRRHQCYVNFTNEKKEAEDGADEQDNDDDNVMKFVPLGNLSITSDDDEAPSPGHFVEKPRKRGQREADGGEGSSGNGGPSSKRMEEMYSPGHFAKTPRKRRQRVTNSDVQCETVGDDQSSGNGSPPPKRKKQKQSLSQSVKTSQRKNNGQTPQKRAQREADGGEGSSGNGCPSSSKHMEEMYSPGHFAKTPRKHRQRETDSDEESETSPSGDEQSSGNGGPPPKRTKQKESLSQSVKTPQRKNNGGKGSKRVNLEQPPTGPAVSKLPATNTSGAGGRCAVKPSGSKKLVAKKVTTASTRKIDQPAALSTSAHSPPTHAHALRSMKRNADSDGPNSNAAVTPVKRSKTAEPTKRVHGQFVVPLLPSSKSTKNKRRAENQQQQQTENSDRVRDRQASPSSRKLRSEKK